MFLFHFALWRDLRLGFSTVAELLRDGLRFLKTIPRSRTALATEILFLRKQHAYYQDMRSGRADSATQPAYLFCSGLASSTGRER